MNIKNSHENNEISSEDLYPPVVKDQWWNDIFQTAEHIPKVMNINKVDINDNKIMEEFDKLHNKINTIVDILERQNCKNYEMRSKFPADSEGCIYCGNWNPDTNNCHFGNVFDDRCLSFEWMKVRGICAICDNCYLDFMNLAGAKMSMIGLLKRI